MCCSRIRAVAAVAGFAIWLGGGRGAVAAEPSFPLTRAVVPSASSATVSDEHQLLVVGRSADSQDNLHVFGILPEKGLLKSGPPAKLTLPLAAGLEKMTRSALSLVFHPKLPLLYVWLDVSPPPANSPQAAAVQSSLDHLIIYKVVGGALQVVGTFGHGPDFAWGKPLGTLCIDPAGTRLFLPNLRDPKTGGSEVGYFDLDKEGLPIPVQVTQPGVFDVFGVEKFELQHRPQRVSLRYDTELLLPTNSTGMYAPQSDVVLLGYWAGPACWDITNRRAGLTWIYYRPIGTSCRVGGHRKFRHIYMCSGDLNQVTVAMMTHADGYPTLLPRVGPVISGEVHLHSNPVVMPGKKHRLAIGGVNTVYVLPLDILGEFDGPPERVTVVAPMVRALAYSDKHERLYVAVEKP